MKKVQDRKFVLLCMLQIWVIITLVRYCIVLGNQSILFREVEEFLPTNATCIESDKRTYGSGRNRSVSYTNTYQYTVKEEIHTVTYYGENRRGKDRILYYNPINPDVVSKYSSYADAAASNAIWIMFVVIGQSVIIFFAVKAIRENKGYVTETAGVVIEDDFQFDMNDRGYSFTDRMSSSQKEESQEVETIPFSRSGEKQEVDKVETIAFTRSNSKPAEEFVLYTEDEYKQMQKGK